MDATDELSSLNSFCQRSQIQPQWKVERAGGPDHYPKYVAEVTLGQDRFSEVGCPGVNDAKRAVARKVLNESNLLQTQHRDMDSTSVDSNAKDELNMLNSFCQRSQIQPQWKVERVGGPDHYPKYVAEVTLGQHKFSEVGCPGVNDAKRAVARKVLNESNLLQTQRRDLGSTTHPSRAPSVDSNATDELNILNSFCQRSQIQPQWKVERVGGPDHHPQFVAEVTLGQHKFSEVGCPGVNDAKRAVARKVLNESNLLQTQHRDLGSTTLSDRSPSLDSKNGNNKVRSARVPKELIDENGPSAIACDVVGIDFEGTRKKNEKPKELHQIWLT